MKKSAWCEVLPFPNQFLCSLHQFVRVAVKFFFQKIGVHQPLAFHTNFSPFRKNKQMPESQKDVLCAMHLSRFTVRFHSRGGVHGVAPDVVGNLAHAHHAGHQRAEVQADAHIPEGLPGGGGGGFALGDEVADFQGRTQQAQGVVRPRFRHAGDGQITVTDGLQFFYAVLGRDPVEVAEAVVQFGDHLGRGHLGGVRGEAGEIGEEHRHLGVEDGRDGPVGLQFLDHAVGQDVAKQIVRARLLGPQVLDDAVQLALPGLQSLARALGLLLPLDGAEHGQLVFDQGAEVLEQREFVGVDRARLGVEHAERPDLVPAGAAHRLAGVEAHEGRIDDERAAREAHVATRIGHDHRFVLQDGVAAERALPRRLRRLQAEARLEPLPAGIEQRDVGDGRVEELRGQIDDAVEALLARRVEDLQTIQLRQPRRFIRRDRGGKKAERSLDAAGSCGVHGRKESGIVAPGEANDKHAGKSGFAAGRFEDEDEMPRETRSGGKNAVECGSLLPLSGRQLAAV